ncbi:hypothetical protein ELE36_17620 [Pseudolysobacter antarcticus]|uniref:DUF1579 domain-containing protein n=1 Tax=Pseudolysobacter antarcticus TaxID=2511995 RepID=A0A411HNK1_9GAMM|nr:hypothetical protein [Pseudolysobacter antarcticus]QBB72036.1 hypothetical protein ELE36_17620 [Pseudolysobacter antarcticus]
MHLYKTLFIGATALTVMSSIFAQSKPSTCTAPENHQFDFWLGKWNVHAANGTLAGKSSITREYGGCVIHEHFETDRGYSGESLNIYDAQRKVWHQSWVDSSGMLLVLEGGFRNGKMELAGETTGTSGAATMQRITWTPNADGSVRQLWESKAASGEWAPVFDGKYTRK